VSGRDDGRRDGRPGDRPTDRPEADRSEGERTTPPPRAVSTQPATHEITALELMWRHAWVRAATYIVLAVLVVLLLWSLRSRYAFALQVGVIGFVVAYVLNPVVEALGRIRVRRSVATVLVYLAVLQLFVFGSILLAQVVGELARFINLIPSAVESLGEQFARLGTWTEGIVERMPPIVTDFLDQRLGIQPDGGELGTQAQDRIARVLETAVQNLLQLFERLLEGGPSALLSGATSIVSTTLQAFLILLASAYFLYDFPRFTANVRRFVPLRWRPVSNDLISKADRAVGGYLRGQLLITTLLGIMIWIGLSLIGIPLATAISFLAAIFNLVPYLGPIVGTIPAVLLGFTVGPWAALLAVVVFVVANQLEGNVLSPLILSRSVDLHPVTVLLAIMAGLGLLGLLGALLAVPTVAMVKVVLEDYLLTRPAYAGADGEDAPDG
jgi:predicted PurR-regulated permease PerM